MAPIKFDENIKEKLSKRSLQPSEKAWDSLSERLDTLEKKDNKKTFWWLGIAASLVGVLLLVSQFMNEEEPQNESQQVVNIETELSIKDTIEINIAEENGEIKGAELEKLIISAPVVAEKKAIKEKGDVLEQEKEIVPELNEVINVIKVEPKVLSFEEEKIQQVVAKIHELEKNNEKVTDKTIDDLLLQAQKEIALNKSLNKNPNLVDAALLLQDVEAELDQSFRVKVFETLKSSYMSLKTAVAQRND